MGNMAAVAGAALGDGVIAVVAPIHEAAEESQSLRLQALPRSPCRSGFTGPANAARSEHCRGAGTDIALFFTQPSHVVDGPFTIDRRRFGGERFRESNIMAPGIAVRAATFAAALLLGAPAPAYDQAYPKAAVDDIETLVLPASPPRPRATISTNPARSSPGSSITSRPTTSP